MKQHRHNGHSPACTYADEVKNTLNNHNTYKSKNISTVKDTREKPIIIQAEEEDNQTVKSLWFCNLKKCKDENVEEWMKRVRSEAEECEYQEQDRWIKEQLICGLDDDGMKTTIISEIEAKIKTDNVTSYQVLMLAKQEEASLMQIIGQSRPMLRWLGQAHVDTVDPATHPEDVQHMALCVGNVAGWTISAQCAEPQDEECPGKKSRTRNKLKRWRTTISFIIISMWKHV